MATSGFNFQGAQNYLAAQNAAAVDARKANATFNSPTEELFHNRRCMAVALGNSKYNVDFMDGEGDMVVDISELILDNPPEIIETAIDNEPKQNVTQDEKDEVAELEIPSRFRVLITGDRDWVNAQPIRDFIDQLPRSAIIIHGAAPGADTIAGRAATSAGMEVKAYPAKWEEEGNAAGPIRNTQMLTEGKPDLVVYFHNNLAESKGTKDMVEQAEKAGIEVLNGNMAEGD